MRRLGSSSRQAKIDLVQLAVDCLKAERANPKKRLGAEGRHNGISSDAGEPVINGKGSQIGKGSQVAGHNGVNGVARHGDLLEGAGSERPVGEPGGVGPECRVAIPLEDPPELVPTRLDLSRDELAKRALAALFNQEEGPYLGSDASTTLVRFVPPVPPAWASDVTEELLAADTRCALPQDLLIELPSQIGGTVSGEPLLVEAELAKEEDVSCISPQAQDCKGEYVPRFVYVIPRSAFDRIQQAYRTTYGQRSDVAFPCFRVPTAELTPVTATTLREAPAFQIDNRKGELVSGFGPSTVSIEDLISGPPHRLVVVQTHPSGRGPGIGNGFVDGVWRLNLAQSAARVRVRGGLDASKFCPLPGLNSFAQGEAMLRESLHSGDEIPQSGRGPQRRVRELFLETPGVQSFIKYLYGISGGLPETYSSTLLYRFVLTRDGANRVYKGLLGQLDAFMKDRIVISPGRLDSYGFGHPLQYNKQLLSATTSGGIRYRDDHPIRQLFKALVGRLQTTNHLINFDARIANMNLPVTLTCMNRTSQLVGPPDQYDHVVDLCFEIAPHPRV